jgi:hypothetical protein
VTSFQVRSAFFFHHQSIFIIDDIGVEIGCRPESAKQFPVSRGKRTSPGDEGRYARAMRNRAIKADGAFGGFFAPSRGKVRQIRKFDSANI